MEPLPAPVADTVKLAEAARLLSRSAHGALPVRDPEGAYLGIVTARAVTEALAEQPDGAPAVTGDLVEMPPCVTADQQLAHALHPLLSASGTGLPVLDAERDEPVGWLSHQGALRSLHLPHNAPTAASPR
ncbi:CBS domain-containing protein [Streptomyces sp. NPDC048405]|nr:CBS domain-containing protein [Streptomyces sp. HB-N217]